MISIEDLNKTQIILLTILISFVTSIATGIITTSLLAEAPVSVTQTINRVVERTIETVTPAPAGSKATTISPEDKALLALFERASRAVVEIRDISNGTSTPGFLGVVVSGDGLVLSAYTDVSVEGVYEATLTDTTRVPISFIEQDEDNDVAVFKLSGKKAIETTPAP